MIILALTELEQFQLIESAFRDGLYEVAASQLEEFIKNYPESEYLDRAMVLLGRCYMETKDYDRAQHIFMEFLMWRNQMV